MLLNNHIYIVFDGQKTSSKIARKLETDDNTTLLVITNPYGGGKNLTSLY